IALDGVATGDLHAFVVGQRVIVEQPTDFGQPFENEVLVEIASPTTKQGNALEPKQVGQRMLISHRRTVATWTNSFTRFSAHGAEGVLGLPGRRTREPSHQAHGNRNAAAPSHGSKDRVVRAAVPGLSHGRPGREPTSHQAGIAIQRPDRPRTANATAAVSARMTSSRPASANRSAWASA